MKFYFLLLSTLLAAPTFGCPFCKSETAAEIRASIFGASFFFNLIVSLLPFVILYIVTIIIYKAGKTADYKNEQNQPL